LKYSVEHGTFSIANIPHQNVQANRSAREKENQSRFCMGAREGSGAQQSENEAGWRLAMCEEKKTRTRIQYCLPISTTRNMQIPES
jgi:hypothetical protein